MAATRVVVDPITRIEGHLRIEAQSDNGRITNAWATSTQFRGIEIIMQGRDPQPLLDYARDKCGVILGVGLGDLGGKAFRIAHMGHCNAPMVLGTLGAVEMGLKALGIPHGSGGVQAAVEYLGREVAA